MRSTLLLPSSLPDIALCTLSLVSVTCLTLRATRAHGRRALRSPGLLVQIHVLQGILSSFTHLISVSLSLARLLPLPYPSPCRSHAPCHCFNRDSCVLWSDHTLCFFSLSHLVHPSLAPRMPPYFRMPVVRERLCVLLQREAEKRKGVEEKRRTPSVCLSFLSNNQRANRRRSRRT